MSTIGLLDHVHDACPTDTPNDELLFEHILTLPLDDSVMFLPKYMRRPEASPMQSFQLFPTRSDDQCGATLRAFQCPDWRMFRFWLGDLASVHANPA